MERFSPDVYHVPFSFAVCWLYREQRNLHFYGIHQETPYLLTQEYKSLPYEPQPLPFSSENAALVTAQKINLPPNTGFCFYRKEIHDISSESDQTLFHPVPMMVNFHEAQQSMSYSWHSPMQKMTNWCPSFI